MRWANFLHFYQPYNQQKDILNRIVNECYLPLLTGLAQRPTAKVVINVNGALLDLLAANGYEEVIGLFKKLLDSGQAEFTGSAMYHAFLPLLPETEVERQISLNFETCRRHLGANYNPVGFFSPEMAISDQLVCIVARLGYKWMSASDAAKVDTTSDLADYVFDHSANIKIIFRNKRISSLVLSGWVRSAEDMIKETTDIANTNKYWFSVMDAETFGHHRIGHEKFLFELYDSKKFDFVTVSDLLASPDIPTAKTTIRPCTWTNDEQDFWMDREKKIENKKANSFILWKDPTNLIHDWQWKLLDLVSAAVAKYADKSTPEWQKARALLDTAEASDQFWWASAKPWWSLEMIESGAYEMKQVAVALGDAAIIAKAEDYYRKILDQAFEWQRTGYIRQKHLTNSSTYMKTPFKDRTPPEWYNQIILEFEDEMKKSALNRDFEKAIKWRDALIKLKLGTDIYDVLHVVDELWTARKIPEVKPFLEHTWDELSDFAKGNLLNVKEKEDFDAWKKDKQSGILK